MASAKKTNPRLGSGMAGRAANAMQNRNASQKSQLDAIMAESNRAMGVAPAKRNTTKPNKGR